MNFTSESRPASGERVGFTIIELLVAMAVTAILAGILLTMTNSVLNAWNRTSGSLSANAEAELIFGMLTEDLQSVLFVNDGNVSFAADVLNNSGSLNGHDWSSSSGNFKPAGTDSNQRGGDIALAETRNGLGGMWLRFFTTGNGGQPQAVAYQIARRHITGDPTSGTNKAPVRYMLYRSTYGTTVRSGYDLMDPTTYMSTGINPLWSPPNGNVIGTNVIDFGVRLYFWNGPILEPAFPYGGSNWSNTPLSYRANGTSGGGEFPNVVDVMVRILTEEGAKQIAALEDGFIPPGTSFDKTWWEIAEANSKVFTQRIYVNTQPF